MHYIDKPAKPSVDDFLQGTRLELGEILLEAWQPLVFVTSSSQHQSLLAYLADETTEGDWYVLSPVTETKISELKNGSLPLRDALTSSWMWLCLQSQENLQVWTVEEGEIPPLCLPASGASLYPENEPVLVTRAIGDSLKLGQMPSSAVSFVAGAARSAFKTIMDFVSETKLQGRPTDAYRTAYDLPIRRFAFQSFEVSFGSPEVASFPNEEFNTARRLLEAGLEWASSTDDTPVNAESDAERAAILRAVSYLTPPSGGPISEVDVSGTWIKKESIKLKHSSGNKVRAALRSISKERVGTYAGRVDELDHNRFGFSLRDITGNIPDKKCSFESTLLDDISEHNYLQDRVKVTGIERDGRLYVAAIAEAEEVS